MRVIWATRGRSWGFRFLLDGGFSDPLATYEQAFAGTEGQSTVFQRFSDRVAIRFPDPEGRRDGAGRVIPHDIVILPPDAAHIDSPSEAHSLVWPFLAAIYAKLWDLPSAPTSAEISRASAQ